MTARPLNVMEPRVARQPFAGQPPFENATRARWGRRRASRLVLLGAQLGEVLVQPLPVFGTHRGAVHGFEDGDRLRHLPRARERERALAVLLLAHAGGETSSLCLELRPRRTRRGAPERRLGVGIVSCVRGLDTGVVLGDRSILLLGLGDETVRAVELVEIALRLARELRIV